MKTASAPGRVAGASAQAGVTLVELMVALTILGLALAAALPEAANWMRGMAVRNAAESVRAGLEKARLEALRRNTTIGFWLVSDSSASLTNGCSLSAAGPSWVVSAASPDGKCAAEPSRTADPQLVDKWSAAEGSRGVELAGVDGQGGAVASATFDSLGQVLRTGSQLARIDVSHSTAGVRPLRVVIQQGGSVRLCDPNVAADDPRRC